jgi:hypothetical protein
MDLWMSWMHGYEDRISIFAHVSPDKQKNVTHPVLREAMGRVKAIPTQWGDTSLVNAEALLYTAALKDPSNKFFLIASETCIPVKPFPEVMRRLMRAPKKGIVDIKTDVQVCRQQRDNPRSQKGYDRAMQCTPRCIRMYRDVGLIAPGRNFWFCSQWKILSRVNARDFCEMAWSPRHKQWRDVYSSCQSDVPDEVAADETMFVNWLVLKYGHRRNNTRWWEAAQLRRGKVTAAMFNNTIIHPTKYKGARRGTCVHQQICEEGTMFARKFEKLRSQEWSATTFACPTNSRHQLFRMTCDK